MTKSIKMKTLLGGIVAFLITLLLSVSTLIMPAKAAGSVFEMEYGASVKLTAGDDGLRFMAKMDKSYRDWIVSSNKVELWGYIAPIEEFDKLDRIGGEYKDLAKKVGGKLDESKIYEYEGYYWSNIAITDLWTYKYQSRAFSAIMFIVDKTGSEPKYIYADLAKDETGVSNIEAQTRTQYEVVNAAMLDGNKSYEEKLLANYNEWYGTGDYPVAAYTQAQYDALVEKASTSNAVQSLVNSDGGSVFVKKGVTTSSAISVDTQGHVVNFYDGNNLVSKQFVANGKDATAPTITKAGYTFEGWIGSFANVTQDENVYAKWKEVKAGVGTNSDKMSSYGATLANGKAYSNATALLGQKVVLESGSIGGGAAINGENYLSGTVGTVDQAYLAYNGSYGFNDYIAIDFTGKNMPVVAFFAQNYDNSMYKGNGNKKGLVVATGLTKYDGAMYVAREGNYTHRMDQYGGKGLALFGPDMLGFTNANVTVNNSIVDSTNGCSLDFSTDAARQNVALGRANLENGTKYRVIMGLERSGNAIKVVYHLYNLQSGSLIESFSQATHGYFTSGNYPIDKNGNETFGSIVLYGHFGTTTVLDKVYSVFTDTTLEQVAHSLGMGGYSLTLGTGVLGTTNGDISELGGYAGNNVNNNGHQDYYALKGEYSFDDYVAFDFTGKNMPEIAFFAKNYDNYMYSENGGKQGVVVASGIMAWDGNGYSPVGNYCQNVVVSGPYMANFQSHDGGWAEKKISINLMDAIKQAKLARANLEDGKQYRVIMGFTKASESSITLNYVLYDLDTNTIVENISQSSYGVFANKDTNFYEESTTDLFGAGGDIVLYGKFETVTTTIDKLWGVYENTTIDGVAKALGMFTATFQNWDGTVLQHSQYAFGEMPEYAGRTPYKPGDAVFSSYEFAGWDKELSAVTEAVTYTAVFTGTARENVKFSGDSTYTYGVEQSNNKIVLKASNLGDNANYTVGQQNANGAWVHQSYLALDGKYALNDYVAFDFTGKNLPEIAFFANNYNDSMYAGTNASGNQKTGIVVVTGITEYTGKLATIYVNPDTPKDPGTFINYGFPYMIQNASDGGFTSGAFANSALGRANLEDGTRYRVIMGFTEHAESAKITLKWCLYNLDTNMVVEESSMSSWGFFTGSNAQVGNMTRDQLSGSIVLYGKFGVACTIDKLHGVFEDTDIATIASGLNDGTTYTVTFKDVDGSVLQEEIMPYGAMPEYKGDLPKRADTDLFQFEFAWDKKLALVTGDVTYTATFKAMPQENTTHSGVTNSDDTYEGVVLGAGGIGDGANYTIGQNNGGFVHQSYLALDGNYALNDYVALDFTGKNLPEIAFFANNYNDSMYAEGTSKTGIVVVTGITLHDGSLESGVNGNGTQINYGFPYMIQDANNGSFVEKSFANSALGRANLEDGTRYRVIMGFTEHAESARITLKWYLYNLDTNTVVEESSMSSWGFLSGSNAQAGNMTRDQLSGSIVLYGKFGVACTIDKVWGVYEDTTIDAIVESIMGENGEGGDEGSGEGSEGETTTYLLGYEKNDSQFDFYAYGSYSDGWYTINETDENGNTVAKDYYIGKHLGNLKQYSLYGGAGLTIYFPQDSFRITEDPQTIVNAKKLLDDLAKVGITKTILNDGRISWLSMLETMDSRFVTDGGEIDTTKLEAYVKSCLEPYANYPGVYGIQLGDEPKYTVLNSYAAVYKAVKKVCKDNHWNLHIQYNLNPMIYANEIFDGGYYDDGTGKKFDDYWGISAKKDRITELKSRYTNYINEFLTEMGADSIMYDDYPLILDESKQAIRDLYIANLEIVAKAAAEKGIPFYHITQTFENKDDGKVKVRRKVTEEGAQWLNNMLLGFGVKQIAYYTYYTRNESDSIGEESYVDGSSFVDYNGNPTALYETMKGIMSNNQIFAKVIMQFNYVQSSVYWNKSGLFDSAPDYISYATSSETFAKATVSYSTSKVGALVTELYDDKNDDNDATGNYMYMAMNIDDPDNSSSTASITLTFDKGDINYKKALVYYGNGKFDTITLTSKAYTWDLLPGQAVYVIPYNE